MQHWSPTGDEQPSNTVFGADRLSRRRLLAAGTTAAVAGVAGCAQATNYIAGLVLDDVNLFNETDRRLTGSIRVTGPGGSTVLDEPFAIEPADDDDDDDNDDIDGESGATYDDVFGAAGSYTVSVELDTSVRGEAATEQAVAVEQPADQHIIVVFGADDLDEAIGVFVIEEFTDIGNHVDA